MKAVWQDTIIEQSDDMKAVEDNQYFPPDSVRTEYLEESGHHKTCPWKGDASYYHVVAAGAKNENAAWYHPEPKGAARRIKGYAAF